MSAYTEQVLIDKLRLLSDSQQSIQTLSHWIMYHRKRHQTSVEIWKRELFKAPKDRRLLYLWLANDIVQTSRKKGNEFVKEFGKLLEPCVSYVYSESDDKVKKQILRMLDIWVERNVYQKEFIAALKEHLNKTSRPPALDQGSSSLISEGSSPIQPYKENPISKAMRELEEAAIAQDLNAEKVSCLREDLVDGRLLKQTSDPHDIAAVAEELNEASRVLDQYRRSLENDLERRGNFITMLTECIVQQENAMNQTTNLLQDCLQKLAQVEELRNQIKGHYSPSLSKADAPALVGRPLPHAPPHRQVQGPTTPPGEPPVDEEDDVILDATATNPYKRQKTLPSTSSSSSAATPSLAVAAYPPHGAPPPLLHAPVTPTYPPAVAGSAPATASSSIAAPSGAIPAPLANAIPFHQPSTLPLAQWPPPHHLTPHSYTDYSTSSRP